MDEVTVCFCTEESCLSEELNLVEAFSFATFAASTMSLKSDLGDGWEMTNSTEGSCEVLSDSEMIGCNVCSLCAKGLFDTYIIGVDASLLGEFGVSMVIECLLASVLRDSVGLFVITAWIFSRSLCIVSADLFLILSLLSVIGCFT